MPIDGPTQLLGVLGRGAHLIELPDREQPPRPARILLPGLGTDVLHRQPRRRSSPREYPNPVSHMNRTIVRPTDRFPGRDTSPASN
jgi:hypothetical protein